MGRATIPSLTHFLFHFSSNQDSISVALLYAIVLTQLLDNDELCVEMDESADKKDIVMFELWGMEFC